MFFIKKILTAIFDYYISKAAEGVILTLVAIINYFKMHDPETFINMNFLYWGDIITICCLIMAICSFISAIKSYKKEKIRKIKLQTRADYQVFLLQQAKDRVSRHNKILALPIHGKIRWNASGDAFCTHCDSHKSMEIIRNKDISHFQTIFHCKECNKYSRPVDHELKYLDARETSVRMGAKGIYTPNPNPYYPTNN